MNCLNSFILTVDHLTCYRDITTLVADMAVAVVCEDPTAGGAEQHDSAVLMRITPRPFRQPIRSRHSK